MLLVVDVYIIEVDDSQIVLMPLHTNDESIKSDKPNLAIQSKSQFCRQLKVKEQGWALVIKKDTSEITKSVPIEIRQILHRFPVLTASQRGQLPPQRMIEHRIVFT